MTKSKNNVVSMNDHLVDKAGKALEGITDLIDKATQTLPDDKLLLFFRRSQ